LYSGANNALKIQTDNIADGSVTNVKLSLSGLSLYAVSGGAMSSNGAQISMAGVGVDATVELTSGVGIGKKIALYNNSVSVAGDEYLLSIVNIDDDAFIGGAGNDSRSLAVIIPNTSSTREGVYRIRNYNGGSPADLFALDAYGNAGISDGATGDGGTLLISSTALTSPALSITNTGNTKSLLITHTGTDKAISITDSGGPASTQPTIYATRVGGSGPVMQLVQTMNAYVLSLSASAASDVIGHALNISNAGAGAGIKVNNTGAGNGIYVSNSGGIEGLLVECTSAASASKPVVTLQATSAGFGKEILKVIQPSDTVAGILIDKTGTSVGSPLSITDAGTGPSILIDKNKAGVGEQILVDGTSTCTGLELNVNASSGLSYAFSFQGSEAGYAGSGTVLTDDNFTGVGYIQIKVSGNTYYIPYGTVTGLPI
jgi:hypothetical protein